MEIDINQVISYVTTAVVSMGVVAGILGNRWFKVAKEAIDVIYKLMHALEDNKVTAEEIAEIKKEAKELIALIKK